jgi:hypothetical protein
VLPGPCKRASTLRRVSDFLDEKRSEIDARLKELAPVVQEYQRLEAALLALDGVPAATPVPARESRRRSAQRRSARSSRRGRPQGTGQRAQQALALVKAHPGIAIPDLAERIGMKQNYLYRVLPSLAEQGLVEKRGRGWHPTATAA